MAFLLLSENFLGKTISKLESGPILSNDFLFGLDTAAAQSQLTTETIIKLIETFSSIKSKKHPATYFLLSSTHYGHNFYYRL